MTFILFVLLYGAVAMPLVLVFDWGVVSAGEFDIRVSVHSGHKQQNSPEPISLPSSFSSIVKSKKPIGNIEQSGFSSTQDEKERRDSLEPIAPLPRVSSHSPSRPEPDGVSENRVPELNQHKESTEELSSASKSPRVSSDMSSETSDAGGTAPRYNFYTIEGLVLTRFHELRRRHRGAIPSEDELASLGVRVSEIDVFSGNINEVLLDSELDEDMIIQELLDRLTGDECPPSEKYFWMTIIGSLFRALNAGYSLRVINCLKSVMARLIGRDLDYLQEFEPRFAQMCEM